MWWAIGLAALYVMHRVSRPTSVSAPPAVRTPMIEGAWKGTTVDMNPFWADDGGPASPFLLKLPAVSTASAGGSGAGGGGSGSGGGGGGTGGGRGQLK
jgi:hypothetical protein